MVEPMIKEGAKWLCLRVGEVVETKGISSGQWHRGVVVSIDADGEASIMLSDAADDGEILIRSPDQSSLIRMVEPMIARDTLRGATTGDEYGVVIWADSLGFTAEIPSVGISVAATLGEAEARIAAQWLLDAFEARVYGNPPNRWFESLARVLLRRFH